MNRSELLNRKQAIDLTIQSLKINKSINLVENLIKDTNTLIYQTEFDNIKLEYDYLLKYFLDGVNDTHRGNIYNKIAVKLQILTNKIICEELTKNDFNVYYAYKRTIKKKGLSLSTLLYQYDSKLKYIELFTETDITHFDKIAHFKELEQIQIDIFNYVWTSFPICNEDYSLLNDIFRNAKYPIIFKELLISAVLLSLLEYYDDQLFITLIDQYQSDYNSISAKSITALVITLLIHTNSISDKGENALLSISDTHNFSNDIKSVINFLIKSKNTDRISKKMDDALMANIRKISPDILRKFTSDTNMSDLTDFESNPEWNKFINNDEFTSNIEEFSKMQMEGGDVFASTFCHLKSFPFFSMIGNWFLPFYSTHSLVQESLSESEIKKVDIMLGSKFLCDSDKFSFVASLNSVPSSQRDMMISQFNEQNIALNEMNAGELSQKIDITKDSLISGYIQNLYRFFKYNVNKKDFIDPFDRDFDFKKIEKIIKLDNIAEILQIIGEFYLKNNLYSEALYYLNQIEIDSVNSNPILYQKIGFCYQNIGDYTQAINHYKKYELLCNNDLWNIKHLAVCYKAVNQYNNAMAYYIKADELKPDNINIVLNIGHCMLEIGDLTNALKQYYKVDYLTGSNLKAWRPLAWCLFLKKDFEQSEAFYNKIMNMNPSAIDYLNYGHLKFAMNDIPQAIALYKKSIESFDNSIDKFTESYSADKHSLLNVGISENDIHILLDSLYYTCENFKH